MDFFKPRPLSLSHFFGSMQEAGEEAGIPPELARLAVPVGAVSYTTADATSGGLKRDVLFCYDLDLPASFVPKPVDGEVESFQLWPLERVVQAVAAGEYKPNCVLVIADFLVRRGHARPDAKGYLELVAALRAGEMIPSDAPLIAQSLPHDFYESD